MIKKSFETETLSKIIVAFRVTSVSLVTMLIFPLLSKMALLLLCHWISKLFELIVALLGSSIELEVLDGIVIWLRKLVITSVSKGKTLILKSLEYVEPS